MWLDHILFADTPIDWKLGCFYLLVTVINAPMNMDVQLFL